MADALHKARKNFVDRASEEVICQLLDDLLDDGIVNDEEKDAVIRKNSSSRANQARCLIDTVKRKGDGASRRMIAHIQTRDPTLYRDLLLPCASEPKTDQDVTRCDSPVTLIPVTVAFWRDKQNDRNIYPVTRDNVRNRVALLITNIIFRVEKYNRNGAMADEENMEKLLTALGYEVVKYRNLTAKAMDRALIDFSAHPKLKATDSVVVVIMSHGKLGTIMGIEWNPEDKRPDKFSINNIYKHLGSEECPALLNKPKILIVQACRGENSGSVLVSDHAALPFESDGEDIEDDTWRVVHKEKDFTSLLSCTPDTVSYRHRTNGSFLIQYIVSQFNKTAHEDDIEELFRKVMQHFEDIPLGNKKQMPTKERGTLTKRFYFFPGLNGL